MLQGNKSHATTINRIVRRYHGKPGLELDVDVQTPEGIIEVETEATDLESGIKHLERFSGPVYLAVTNKEALPEALRATRRQPHRRDGSARQHRPAIAATATRAHCQRRRALRRQAATTNRVAEFVRIPRLPRRRFGAVMTGIV